MPQIHPEFNSVLKVDAVLGKKILITGGAAKEIIDGVRHYANCSRVRDHGLRVAERLSDMGAKITLVTTDLHPCASDARVISTAPDGKAIVSAAQMEASCQKAMAESDFDLILHLASVSSLRPAQTSERKLKVKSNPNDPVFLEVAPNIDLMACLRQNAPTIGYSTSQVLEAPAEWQALILSQRHEDRVIMETTRDPTPQRNLSLRGRKIIVTSGPTVERLTVSGDVISNFSTGRQGHDIACALADCGAQVFLVSGPTTLADPIHQNIQMIHVTSARSMRDACLETLPADAYVGVAAVADFGIAAPLEPLATDSGITRIELSQNPDILQTMGTHPSSRPTVVVGFAAETNDLETYAKGKLVKKNADVIFANLVGSASCQLGLGKNHVHRVTCDGVHDCGETDKYQVGLLIADFISCRLQAQPAPTGSQRFAL